MVVCVCVCVCVCVRERGGGGGGGRGGRGLHHSSDRAQGWRHIPVDVQAGNTRLLFTSVS